jgi:1,4-alpha-glucan branching enzyme
MNNFRKDVGAVLHKDHVSFRVWAPFAKSVAVTGSFNDWGKTPMQPEDGGYWHCDVKGAEAGQEYRYVIDTGKEELKRNDPRALRVNTSAGNSVIVDTDFDWEGDNFELQPVNKQIIYELYIGTFNRKDPAEPGTFATAIEKLDYLIDLGVTTIELMPIGSTSPEQSWWGYIVDYIYAVESQYGGRREFLEFVKAAHKRGLGVILDVVYNHFDSDPDLGLWRFDGWSSAEDQGGIYFYSDWRAFTPWDGGHNNRPDYGRPEVRDYILSNIKMWLKDCHIDGFRVDSTGFIRTVNGIDHDPSSAIPDGWSLLQDITELSRKTKPGCLLVAEDLCGNDYISKPRGEAGLGFSAQWELNMPYELRQCLEPIDDGKRNLGPLAAALERYYNGDAFQRVVYSDSHDSAANGAKRLNEEISPGHPASLYARRRSLLASAIILTIPGVPMFLEGQEFMQGGSFSNWQALDWEQAEKLSGIVEAHKHLIALRRNAHGNTRGLIGQSFAILHLNEESKILAYHRWDQGGSGDDVIVVVNLANRMQKDYFLNFPRKGVWRVRFNSDWKGYSPEFKDTKISEVNVENDGAPVTVGPYSVLIFSQD